MGSPSTAPGPVKKVIWPMRNGLSGIVPLGFSCARAIPATPKPAAEAPSVAAAVTPSLASRSLRVTGPFMFWPPATARPFTIP